jgi:hypothetical protein
MGVEMGRDPGPGRLAEVGTDVDSLAAVRGSERNDRGGGEIGEFMAFGDREILESRHGPVGHHEHVSAAVGIRVEQNRTRNAAVHHERGIVIETKDPFEERTGLIGLE